MKRHISQISFFLLWFVGNTFCFTFFFSFFPTNTQYYILVLHYWIIVEDSVGMFSCINALLSEEKWLKARCDIPELYWVLIWLLFLAGLLKHRYGRVWWAKHTSWCRGEISECWIIWMKIIFSLHRQSWNFEMPYWRGCRLLSTGRRAATCRSPCMCLCWKMQFESRCPAVTAL